jgi:hypothetical protein
MTRYAWSGLALLLVLFGACAPEPEGEEGAVEAALTPDAFSIVVLPDTQYYSHGYGDPANANHSWPFDDQVKWIVAHQHDADKNIQLVIGLGDITDDAGPRPSGKAACIVELEANHALQWTRAENAIGLLDAANIPYSMTIGNHDYDCQADHGQGHPQSRSTSNFDEHFGPSRYASKSWFHGGRMNPASNANFYNVVTLGGTAYLVMSLEFYPRDSVIAWANEVLDNHASMPAIIATHAYLFPDDTGSPGSGQPVYNGKPDGVLSYHMAPSCAETCTGTESCNDAPTGSCGNGNNGSDMWTKIVSQHKNIVLVVSGHFQEPDPGPSAPNNNGVGYRTQIAPTGQRLDELVSDYQGQSAFNEWFGNGYLRVYTIVPSAGTLHTLTYSPPAVAHPTLFPKNTAGKVAVPVATRTDVFNQFTIPFQSTSSSAAAVTIQSPAAGATVASPFDVKATYSGSLPPNHFEVWSSGVKLGNAPVVNGDTMNASFSIAAGTHALTVLAVDSEGNVIKSSPIAFTSK